MIKVENLTKTYHIGTNEKVIFNNINFEIKPGDVCAILGPSGIGKSTLLYMLGLLDIPTKGKILIKNKDVTSLSTFEKFKFRNEFIGFVFQQHFLIYELNVWENVAFSKAILQNSFNLNIKKEALELLKFLNLESISYQMPHTLSHGEAQRVAIARAIFNSPEILIMDEPTGNLDFENKKTILKLISTLNKSLNTTIIIATHDEFVKNYCNKILFIKNTNISIQNNINFKNTSSF